MPPVPTLGGHHHRARVQQLNEAVSATARRLFQSTGVTNLTGSDVPELSAFVATLACESSRDSDHASQCHTGAAVRRVFQDRDAQWLSRSALHSGASSLLCDQLLRSTEDVRGLDLSLVLALLFEPLLAHCTSSNSERKKGLGSGSRACIWRARKPAFHTMPCFSTWDTLAPFLARVGRHNPQAVTVALNAYSLEWQQPEGLGAVDGRVNCKFAHVVGLWRLMDAVGGASASVDSAPTRTGRSVRVGSGGADAVEADTIALLDALLRFLVRSTVLESVVADVSSTRSRLDRHDTLSCDKAAHFDDLLMDKFFARLPEFLFTCPHAEKFTAHAMQSAIVDCIRDSVMRSGVGDSDALSDDANAAVPLGLSVFAAASSMFINGFAEGLVARVRDIVNEGSYEESGDRERRSELRMNPGAGRQLRLFLVGFCAHVDLVPIEAVLAVFGDLLQLYKAAVVAESSASTGVSPSHSSPGSIEILLWIVYVAVYRTDAVRELRQRHEQTTSSGYVSEDAVVVSRQYRKLLAFQGRFTSDVESQAFFAMPLEWMIVFWREWFGFTHDDVASFVQGDADHRECRYQTEQQEPAQQRQEPELPALEAALPIRTVDVLFMKQAQLLGSHLIRPNCVDRILQQQHQQYDTLGLSLLRSRTKRRRFVAPADPTAEERKLNVILLPEAMERVCSFLTAKRLCRLASVCRGFADVSRSDRLWQPLFVSLVSREDAQLLLECRHVVGYIHDWRAMYRERRDAQRRLRRKKQKQCASREHTLHPSGDATSGGGGRTREDSDEEMDAPTYAFAPQLCRICGCCRLLTSESQATAHMKTHVLFTCKDSSGPVSCDAAFPSRAMLKKHQKQCHGVKRTKSSNESWREKPRLACGYEGCAMSYASLKRLATHRQRKSHADASERTEGTMDGRST